MPLTAKEKEALRYQAAKRKIQNDFIDGVTIEAVSEGAGTAIVGILETIAMAWIIAAFTGPEPITKFAAIAWTVGAGLVAIGLILGILYKSWDDFDTLIKQRDTTETREDATYITNMNNF